MSEVAPIVRVGRTEYHPDSFQIKAPFFSDSLTVNVVNTVDMSVLIPNLVIPFNRLGNLLIFLIPHMQIPDIGPGPTLLTMAGPWPTPVQTFVGDFIDAGLGVSGVNGVDTRIQYVLANVNNPLTIRMNLQGIAAFAANAAFEKNACTVQYFVKP